MKEEPDFRIQWKAVGTGFGFTSELLDLGPDLAPIYCPKCQKRFSKDEWPLHASDGVYACQL